LTGSGDLSTGRDDILTETSSGLRYVLLGL